MLLVLLGVTASFFAADPRTPNMRLKPLAHHFSEEVNTVFLVLGIGSLLYAAWRNRDRALAVRTLATVGAETGLYMAAKGVTWFGFGVLSRPSGTDGGFPSGHTACAVVVAWLLSERVRIEMVAGFLRGRVPHCVVAGRGRGALSVPNRGWRGLRLRRRGGTGE